ncbi:MAG: FAD/NAD(P)-binding protein [Paracoccus sp. (in: a-proteobacteria)]|uniref:FAD/NAD(P)-binding protein n=1 Tax=Paracoccus sp. TaxID=267 RepID=UPI0026DFB133|nr:FAD/NAD(P)-binding protein [Paracoccus sp. (in: a-proteobacteria)]MDO5622903.1 FAD/NAD(P)-binding protein [Paracoccus sp. (in: a-proteobacteria)]
MVTVSLQRDLRIGLIGLGSRGLSVLERVVTLAADNRARRISVIVFEDGEPGCGAHPVDQPDHMMLNTIAAQLGIHPDEAALSDVGGSPAKSGPDFLAWCRSQNLRVNDDGTPDPSGRPVAATDFLPRRLLGAYLTQACQDLLRDLPAHILVTIRRERALGVRLGPWHGNVGRGYVITGASGEELTVDCLILTTGHKSDDQSGSDDLEIMASEVGPGQALVIEGVGLTAMDALADLTRGRGGCFLPKGPKATVYSPSGREPLIYLQSRSGLPFHTRPETSMERRRHLAMALTSKRIADLRAATPDGRLDFGRDVLPLMRLEMRGAALAVRRCHGEANRLAREEAILAEIGARDLEELDQYLREAEAEHGSIDIDRLLLRDLPQDLTPEDYQDWFLQQLRADLIETHRGLLESPQKAALETWRDLRDQLREAVNHHGLTPASHRTFYGSWAGLINRLVAGPQKERHQDLVALTKAGLVRLLHPNAPRPEGARTIKARAGRCGLFNHHSGPIADLHRLGLIRAVIAEPGLDGIETRYGAHAVSRNGQVIDDLWILGPATEGSTYYNHYVPSPGAPNPAMTDAHLVAAACLDLSSKAGKGIAA